jgi:hypothetical protein
MNKRILAYAVIILSVVYFYSSEAIANGDDYFCQVDSATTDEELAKACPNIQKGTILQVARDGVTQLCGWDKQMVKGKYFIYCSYRGAVRKSLN